MPYIGKQLVRGQNRELDDISSSFNGATTTFNLTVAGDSVTPGSALQLFISIGGVLQNPNTDFTVAGNQITFSTAPGSGLSFFGYLQGDAVDFNTPADGSVTTAKLGSNLTINVADGSAATPSIQFNGSGTDTGFYSPAADEVAITTGGVENVEFGTAEVVFNDGGADIDFRIEGDTEPNLFKIDAGTDQVQVANLNGGPLAGTRNHIINGDMRIAQRATSSSGVTDSIVYRTVDRFIFATNGAGPVFTESQSSTAPTGFKTSLKIDCTTADASLDNDAYINVTQRFEGFDCQEFQKGTAAAKQITVSFWVRSSKTGLYCVELFDTDNTRQITSTYTISSANTWEYKTLTFAADTTGSLDNDNNNSLSVSFWLGAGTDFTSGTFVNNTWAANTNANRVSSSQVNIADNTANEWYITGVQLEAGSVATPFERRSYGQELALCQRYYERGSFAMAGAATSGLNFGGWSSFAVTKRAAPTITPAGKSYTNATGATAFGTDLYGTGLYATSTASPPSGVVIYIDWTASIEL